MGDVGPIFFCLFHANTLGCLILQFPSLVQIDSVKGLLFFNLYLVYYQYTIEPVIVIKPFKFDPITTVHEGKFSFDHSHPRLVCLFYFLTWKKGDRWMIIMLIFTTPLNFFDFGYHGYLVINIKRSISEKNRTDAFDRPAS